MELVVVVVVVVIEEDLTELLTMDSSKSLGMDSYSSKSTGPFLLGAIQIQSMNLTDDVMIMKSSPRGVRS
jgi:hypothetical protein